MSRPADAGSGADGAIYALRRGGKAVNVSGVGEKVLMDVPWMMDQQIEFIDGTQFRNGGFTNLVIVP